MKIAMTVSNDGVNDVRVIKEAKTLSEVGHDVYVFGSSEYGEKIDVDNIKIFNSKYSFTKRWILSLKNKNKNSYKEEDKNSGYLSDKFKIKHKLKEIIKGYILVYLIEKTQSQIFKAIVRTKNHFDCIHCHDLDTLKVGIWYKKKYKSKLVYDSHELWTELSGINYYVKKRYSRVERKSLSHVDRLITVSPSISEEFKERYNSLIKTILIRNMPSYKDSEEVSIPNDKEIKVIYIGYYIEGRGIEDIISTAVNFPENVSVSLRIQNDPVLIKHLKKQAFELGLEKKVRVLEFVPQDQVISEISKYDIGLLPYLPVSLNNLYCLPNKLFQYLSAGVCVVSNDLPDVKDILNKYDCGLTYDRIESLNEIINYLGSNTNRLYEYKMNSLKAIRLNLNWKEEKIKLLDLYKAFNDDE